MSDSTFMHRRSSIDDVLVAREVAIAALNAAVTLADIDGVFVPEIE